MSMVYLESSSTDPSFNLALEQYVFDQMDKSQEYFMFWQNNNSIIIGKNQNTIEEINLEFVKKHNIQVVRRLSGGGAVYHDLGNLNFTFIADSEKDAGMDLKKFSRLVAEALNQLGIPAEASGRNDILIKGLKFSGNAQYIRDGRIMHHGTLMFDSDIKLLSHALRTSESKIESKGIKSIKSRVTNIKEHLPYPMRLVEFQRHLLQCLFADIPVSTYTLTEHDMSQIKKLQQEVYASWNWNFGYSPDCQIRKRRRFEGCGEIELYMDIEQGQITAFNAYGDYFGIRDVSELYPLLIGVHAREDALNQALSGINIGSYFHGLEKQELINLILL